jgi:phosphomethylpyrimidine synthase
MTQALQAKNNVTTQAMRIVAEDEGVTAEQMRQWVASGEVVIPANPRHENLRPVGIGEPLRVKVNANIGTSPQNDSLQHELAKLDQVQALDAESVMDLSTEGDLDHIRREIIARASCLVGTVPIYQVMADCGQDESTVGIDEILTVVEQHGRDGVDFITVHCGLTLEALPLVERRVMGIVSRGGSFLARWMQSHQKQNPLFDHFDDLLAIAREYDMTLSLGDGLRPGALADASDEAQLHELRVLGELTRRARQAGVQVMVEGPGHVPLDQIEKNVRLEREWCDKAPFYLLGPLVTDIAPGYDHISGAIGGCLAAWWGAAFLCYLTPAEHLRLPSIQDVREGVVASKIAAHAADVARGRAGAALRDKAFSECRHRFDWDGMFGLALDNHKPRQIREDSTHLGTEECSMCGAFCALKAYRGGANEHS